MPGSTSTWVRMRVVPLATLARMTPPTGGGELFLRHLQLLVKQKLQQRHSMEQRLLRPVQYVHQWQLRGLVRGINSWSSLYGQSAGTGAGRWGVSQYTTCNQTLHLICYVNP